MTAARGIRGASIAGSNTRESILETTTELLAAMVESNEVDPDDVAAAFFTTSSDLNAEFPAAAARRMGWIHVPLLCAQEIDAPNAMSSVVRILLIVNTDKKPSEIRFQYLRGAIALRESDA